MNVNINSHKPYCEGKHSVFISKENNCTHRGKNASRCAVRQFKIDGDVFKDGDAQRCDFLLLNDDKQTSYYIELKGSDLPKAINQIEHTICLSLFSKNANRIFAYILY